MSFLLHLFSDNPAFALFVVFPAVMSILGTLFRWLGERAKGSPRFRALGSLFLALGVDFRKAGRSVKVLRSGEEPSGAPPGPSSPSSPPPSPEPSQGDQPGASPLPPVFGTEEPPTRPGRGAAGRSEGASPGQGDEPPRRA